MDEKARQKAIRAAAKIVALNEIQAIKKSRKIQERKADKEVKPVFV